MRTKLWHAMLKKCNKWPRTGWLKTIEMYSLTMKEARCPKSRCQDTWFLLEALRDNSFHASHLASGGRLQSLVFLGLWTHYSNLSASIFTWPLPPVYVCMCVYPVKIPVLGFRTHPTPLMQCNLILTWFHLKGPYFQIRSHSSVPQIGIRTYLLGDTIEPITRSRKALLSISFSFRILTEGTI